MERVGLQSATLERQGAGQIMNPKFALRSSKSAKSSIVARLRCLLIGDREGSALVEFTLVVPMLMALVIGILSLGIVLTSFLQVTSAAGAAARTVALSRGTTVTDPCAAAVTAAKGAAATLNSSLLKIAITWTAEGTGVVKSYGGSSTPTCSGLNTDLNEGDNVSVSVTYPTTAIFLGFAPKTLNLMGNTNQTVE